MSYLDRINECNNMRRDQFYPLLVEQRLVGWIRLDLADHLQAYDSVIRFDGLQFDLHDHIQGFEQRTSAVQGVIDDLIVHGHIPQHYGEVYPATSTDKDHPEFLIDRGVASFFGTRTFGQHLNGYVQRPDGIWMWVARRARDRGYEPGKLDQMVAGGFPYNITAEENMRKECMEEAGMSEELADQSIAVGAITCCYENPRGLKPETLYIYDLEVPEDFVPENTDGEVEEFMLMPLKEVAEIVRDTTDFKLNCNLVVIDFLIRHGYIKPEDEDYDQLVAGLHQSCSNHQ